MPTLPAATAAVRIGTRDLLRERMDAGALAAGDLVLVACSGGADSLALAAQLAFCAPRLDLRAGLVTVDHALQTGSAAQAARVAEQGRALGLDPVLVEGPGEDSATAARRDQAPTGSAGPEGEARRRRLAAFDAAIERTGARAILLGHTMEDQAETVLLALARGSGTRALAGMAPIRGRLWRPLLGVRRAETEQACRELGLEPWQDPTNRADGPWRTAAGAALPRAALRARALPALADALGQDPVPALARTAALAADDADHLDALAAEALARLTAPRDGDGARWLGDEPGEEADAVPTLDVAIEGLAGLPPALLGRVVHGLLQRAGAPGGDVTRAHVREVSRLVTDWRGQGPISIPGGIEAVRAYGRLSLVSSPGRRSNGRAQK